MISYVEARRIVAETAAECFHATPRKRERVAIEAARGRVLAEPLHADRDAPPFDRSTRDGFAVRYSDIVNAPVTLRLAGEVRAGAEFTGRVKIGECVQIMTGAAVPPGLNAVVMIEHTEPAADQVTFKRALEKGANVVLRGSEAKAGAQVLPAGQRLGAADLAIAAQFGHASVAVFARPHVSILSTGDELARVEEIPGPFRIRNSNRYSLGSQVELAGGVPEALGNAADDCDVLRERIAEGLKFDALVISGGVSMGKYDLVEQVLRELGAEFRFDSVAIRPGKPAVFGVCRGKPVLGLPGNPVSTMVTFEVLGVPMVDVLSGTPARQLSLVKARLRHALRLTAPLTHFIPAKLVWFGGDTHVEALASQGSGDVAMLARADCFLVVPETKLESPGGEWVDVLLWRDRV
jgi:molybdopterin molybdotransferase